MVSPSGPQGPGEDRPLGGTLSGWVAWVLCLLRRQLVWPWDLEPDCLDCTLVYSFLALCP